MGLKEQIQLRTRNLALGIISLCGQLPGTLPNNIVVRQLIRASCSVGANYRAVSRAKSTADFINKLHIVEEEADESIFWLELLQEIEPAYKDSITSFISEMNEILSIVVAARKTAKNKLACQKS
jgi:four helix bundle protein